MHNVNEEEFHKLYWLGDKPKTFSELAVEMNKSLDEIRQYYKSTQPLRESSRQLRQKWLSRYPLQDGSREKTFGQFLTELSLIEEKCCYCGISQEQLDLMNDLGLLETKRGRGATLEIERIRPNESYANTENLAFACYWCNNAKTDTFTCKEFKEIAKGINSAWNQRLKLVERDEKIVLPSSDPCE